MDEHKYIPMHWLRERYTFGIGLYYATVANVYPVRVESAKSELLKELYGY